MLERAPRGINVCLYFAVIFTLAASVADAHDGAAALLYAQQSSVYAVMAAFVLGLVLYPIGRFVFRALRGGRTPAQAPAQGDDGSALAEARRRIDAALQAAEVGTYYWDIRTDLLTGDRNFVAIFGEVIPNDRSSAPIGDFVRVIHPDDHARVLQAIQETLETDASFEVQYRILTPGGERWVNSRGVVERDAQGKPTGWAGALVDITAAKTAEAGLRLATERFQLLMGTAIDYAVVFSDLNGVIVEWLGGAAAITGFSPAEAVGKRAEIFFTPEDNAAGVPAREMAKAKSEGRALDKRWHQRKDGGRFFADGVMVALRDEDGTLRGFGKVFQDVTRQKLADEELARVTAESERRKRLYETFLTTTPDLAYVFDLQHRFIYVNKILLAMWGKTWEEAIGKTCLELGYEPWHAAMHDREIDQVVATKQPIRGEVPFTGTFGRRIYDYIFLPIIGEHGEVEAVAGTTRDVTERKEAELRLAESEEQFRTLFTIMSEGYCIIELIYDEQSQPVDFRFVFANPAYAVHSGLPDVVGRSVLEVVPGYEQRFITGYARVAETGEPWRYVDRVAALDRWFEVSCVRAGGEGSRRVAILFNDVSERKRAEENLAASERQLAEVFKHAPALMGVLRGPEHVFERVNARYEQVVGGRSLVGQRVRDALPEVVDQGFIELLDRVYQSGEPYVGTDVRVFLDQGDGRSRDEHYIDFVYQPLRGPNGEVSGIIVQGVDQTERKRAERELREREEFLSRLLASSQDSIKVLDLEGRVQSVNDCGQRMLECDDLSTIIGLPWTDLWRDDDRVAAQHAVAEAQAGRVSGFVGFCPTHKGKSKWWDVVVTPIRGTETAVDKILVVSRDVTGRQRDERNARFLADTSAYLSELVDYESTLRRIANLAVGVFADWCVVDVLNADGTRRRLAAMVSEEATRLGAALDTPDAIDVVPHVLRSGEPEVIPALAAIDAAQSPLGAERVTRLRQLGIHSYLAVPLLTRGRVVGGMTFLGVTIRNQLGPAELVVGQELAQRVATAIENAQLYRSLQEQDRRKDEFLATLAHELRNPLAPVRNGVDILRMTASDEDSAVALEMMERQLSQMVHLVDDLMDVSRVSSGKVILRRERIDVRSVLGAALETSRQLIEEGEHQLSVELPPEPLWVEADRTRLVQIYANLLNNAAKYTPRGGKITLTAALEEGQVVVRVSDTGVGIPSEMLGRVFDMFTQVGTSLERSQGGLGIGLTLVRRLVELHDGVVVAGSEGPNRGSTFTVRLPAVEAGSLAAVETEAARAVDPNAAALAILVVDDNRDSADSLALLLRMKGHVVRTAHDGPHALRELGSFRPQLIFLDIGLPGMNGYEVARRIRGGPHLRGVTLVALTGWGQDEDRRRTQEAGFDHHLVKPADAADIARILSEAARG